MSKRIQYDNFATAVVDQEAVGRGPNGEPVRTTFRVLALTDHDSGETHEFAYPLDAAVQVGGALTGGPEAASGPRVQPATTADMNVLTRRGSGGPVVGG